MSPGEGYGANYACNSCHADSKGDGRIWKAVHSGLQRDFSGWKALVRLGGYPSHRKFRL